MQKLHRKPRKKSHLIIGLLFVVGIVGLVVTFPPEGILLKAIFFLLFFGSLFYLLRFAFNQSRRALLLSSGLTLYLILRALDLHHWLYPLLIAAIIISIEVYRRKS